MSRFRIVLLVISLVIIGILLSLLNNIQPQLIDTEDEILSKDKIIIAGIYRDGGKSIFINEGLSAQKRAKELGAFEFIFIDGKNSEADYLQGVQSIIDEEVDGVILCQPYESLSEQITESLEKAGIPFVTTNTSLRDDQNNILAPIIGVDDYALGHMIGDWTANYTIKNGLVDTETVGLLTLSNSSLPNMELRQEGQINRFLEMVPYFDESNIFNVDYNGSAEDGLDKGLHTFINNFQISYWLVMSTNDEGALGAVRALEQVGMDSKAAVVSVGGSVTTAEFKREYSALKASSYFSSSKIGVESVNVLFNLIVKQEIINYETYFNAVIITKENYQEFVEDK